MSSGKCKHKLAYNVSGLILPVPTILKTMNEELLAASALLVQSGGLMVIYNIKLA